MFHTINVNSYKTKAIKILIKLNCNTILTSPNYHVSHLEPRDGMYYCRIMAIWLFRLLYVVITRLSTSHKTLYSSWNHSFNMRLISVLVTKESFKYQTTLSNNSGTQCLGSFSLTTNWSMKLCYANNSNKACL